MGTSQDHHGDRAAQLERARAIARDRECYELFMHGILGWAETHPGKRDVFYQTLAPRILFVAARDLAAPRPLRAAGEKA